MQFSALFITKSMVRLIVFNNNFGIDNIIRTLNKGIIILHMLEAQQTIAVLSSPWSVVKTSEHK